jgi:hypothetical protein
MCPILDGYGIMTAFSFPYTPSCEVKNGGAVPPLPPLSSWHGAQLIYLTCTTFSNDSSRQFLLEMNGLLTGPA